MWPIISLSFSWPSCLVKAKWCPNANKLKSQDLNQCCDHENPEISEFSRSHGPDLWVWNCLFRPAPRQVGTASLVLRFRWWAAPSIYMSGSNPHPRRELQLIRAYGIAGSLGSGALVLPHWPAFHLGSAPVSLFLCAVMFSAWFGGVGPGFLATVLSALAFYYSFPATNSTSFAANTTRFRDSWSL